MRNRIKLIMESENMTPARFADKLHIGRAVVSHILNGRNNPSLDVITRILTQMPNINSDWLLTGNGEMYKTKGKPRSDNKPIDQPSSFPNLFSNLTEKESESTDSKYRKESTVNIEDKLIDSIINERITTKDRSHRKIKQIIICYNDNTFETFGDK